VRPRYLSQTALLLTFFTTSEDAQAANFWLARAVKIGKIAESQSNPPTDNRVETQKPPMWRKRLWWSIMIRDRSLCLGLRRVPQMTSKELRFVADPITEDDLVNEINESRVYDKPTKKILVSIFREQCQLAVLLTAMVTLAAAPNNLACSSLSDEELFDIFATISSTKEALGDWMAFSRLPARLAETSHGAVKRIIQITLMYYQ
jgi:hypothetical protein